MTEKQDALLALTTDAPSGDVERGRNRSAVQSLHEQAHNGPSDTLYAEYCLREPCRSVA